MRRRFSAMFILSRQQQKYVDQIQIEQARNGAWGGRRAGSCKSASRPAHPPLHGRSVYSLIYIEVL
jgi:hypothetical protein